MHTRRITGALGAAVLVLALAGCGSDDDSSADEAPSATATDQAAFFAVTDPWVKAADSGMTAIFGTLVNDSAEDVTVTAATSDITTAMELHETVQADDGAMAMQPKEDGFTVPAGGSHELEPGGDHLMAMDLTRPLQPGETVRLTLTFADGSSTDLDATVKSFAGADEEYQNGDMGDMGGEMDMSSESPAGDR